MAKLSPSAVHIYEEYMEVFRKLSRNLTAQPWFAQAPWFISKGIYARGIGFQLAKTHWHNHEGQGVHLETWIDEEVLASREIAVVIHVEPDVPQRRLFNEHFRRLAKERSSFTLREEHLMELWKKKLPFVKTRAAADLTREFEALRELGCLIDEALCASSPC